MPPGEDFQRDDISDVVLEQIKPIYPHLKLAMLFGDGEPMVYRGFWDVVKNIRKASPGCCIEFFNNGTMMHERNILKCFEYEISSIGLSLGGATPKTHDRIRKGSSLVQIIENFKLLLAMKRERGLSEPHIVPNIVIMRSNHKELLEFVDLCYELGACSIEFQTLFVTHPSMEEEVVKEWEVKPYLSAAKLKMERLFRERPSDRYSRLQYVPVDNAGYCRFQQPWNTVYILHDGSVVPDCHWWSSVRDKHLNECGKIDETTSLSDVWHGSVFAEIRKHISEGNILPQCRGCGLAGGVVDSVRCEDTDHANPDEEQTLYIPDEKISVSSVSAPSNSPPDQPDRFYIQWRGGNESSGLFKEHQRRIAKYNSSFDYSAYLNNIELAYKERLSGKSVLRCQPIYVDFEPYNLCSYKCLSCESALKHRGHQVPDLVIEDVLDLMPTAEHVEYAKVGEIFMLPEKILPLIRRIREFNPCIVMRTNSHGQTITDEVARTLVDVEFEQLSISLDSHTQEGFKTFRNGNLSEVLDNIKTVQHLKLQNNSEYPQILVCSQLQRHCEPLEIVKLAKQLDAVAVVFQAMVVYPGNEAEYNVSSIQAPECYGGYDQLNKKMKDCKEYCETHKISLAHPLGGLENHQVHFGPKEKLLSLYHLDAYTCPTGDPWYRFCMNGNGELAPCCFHSTFMGIRNGCLHTDIPVVSVGEFWNHDTMQGLRKMLTNGSYSPGCFCWKRHAFTSDPQEVNVPLDKLFTWWNRNAIK